MRMPQMWILPNTEDPTAYFAGDSVPYFFGASEQCCLLTLIHKLWGSSPLWACCPKVLPSLRCLDDSEGSTIFIFTLAPVLSSRVLSTYPSFLYWSHILYSKHINMRYYFPETDLSPRSNAGKTIPFHKSHMYDERLVTIPQIRSRIQMDPVHHSLLQRRAARRIVSFRCPKKILTWTRFWKCPLA